MGTAATPPLFGNTTIDFFTIDGQLIKSNTISASETSFLLKKSHCSGIILARVTSSRGLSFVKIPAMK